MNLLNYTYDKHSCCGNDGIIEKIFDTMKIKNGSFVEFGAWDGVMGCNSRKLFEEGWTGTFIEPRKDRYNQLVQNYYFDGGVECINGLVGIDKDTYDERINFVADFCSIDIDGLDLSVFETFEKSLPKVVCMEGGQMLHPHHSRIPDSQAQHNIQQSLSVIDEVARKKGYRILCSYQDTFLVQDEYYDLFDVEEDVYVLYLQGVDALARRLPWIRRQLKKVGLSNEIIETVMRDCGFDNYGWDRRKEWAIKESEVITGFVERLIDEHKH